MTFNTNLTRIFSGILHVIIFLGLLPFPGKLKAQAVQYRFQHLNSENGLPQNTVYDICQDPYGFIWLSTKNGICRYDGYATKVFKPTESFKYDVVDLSQCIAFSESGHIVFGTGSGLYFIDIENERITKRVDFSSLDTSNLYINNISSLLIDDDLIWLGTGNGLLRYDPSSGKAKYFSGNDLIPGYKSSRCWIKSVVRGPDGAIWFSTPEGVVKLNTKNLTTEVYNTLQSGSRFISNNYFSSLAFDKNNRLWAGTLRQGVFCMNFEDSVYSNINFTGLSDTSGAFNEVKRLICDSKGSVWAGTQYTGLVKINVLDYSYQRIRSSLYSQHSLSSDLISALFEDTNRILWVGTYNNGADRTTIDGSVFTHIPFASTDSSCFNVKAVECFAEHDSVNVWVGTMKGLFLFNKKNLTCSTFEEFTLNKIPLPHNSIAGVARIGDFLWIGTRSKKLLKVNLTDNTYKYFQPDSTNPVENKAIEFRSLVKTQSNNLYFSYDTRIFQYNRSEDKLDLVMDNDSSMLEVKRIWKLFSDSEENIFLSSDISGLHYLNVKTGKLENIVPLNSEIDKLTQNATISQLPSGGYAVTSYKGFYEMDNNFKFLSYYNSKDGLSDNKVCNAETDSEGNVWMATFNGLSMFNPVNKSIRNFSFHDGVVDNEFRESKSFKSQNGLLFFPGGKGFTFFNPLLVTETTDSGSVFLTSVKILGKQQHYNSNLNQLQQINIPAGNNFFVIQFSSTLYNTSRPSRYMYKLEGFDNEWVSSGSANTASYTNLNGGTYLFKVKLANSPSAEKTIQIIIGTVFYKTWWFRLLLFVSLALLLYNFVKYRESQINKKESIKIVDYFANSFYGRNSVEEILWDVCRNCISRLGFEDAVVYMLEEDRQVLVQKAAYGPKNPKDFEIENPLEIPVGVGIVGSVAKSGKAEIIYDTSRDSRYISDDEKRLSEIAVPIIYQGKVIGVIDSENSRKRFFNEEHLRILNTIASICSTKIAKAQSDVAAHERELKLLEIGKKVAETRLMALRAQMNPHFIFNSLNAIQECIVNSKVEEAHTYLSRFSRLLRMVIDYSEKSLISLDKEIEFLNLYLGLESLRFGQSFQYRINIDPAIDEEETLLPSLLIQPFIENAIWHGLLHKAGDRKLLISFSSRGNEQLLCVVEDNGIGRKKAAEIKAGKFDSQQHESKGMQISQERIDLVKLQTEFNTEIVVEDLYDILGQPSGTRVSVILPLDIS